MIGIDATIIYILYTSYICSMYTLILKNLIQLTNCDHQQCQSSFKSQRGTTIEYRQYLIETAQNQ
ncbi:unnamed protein product, partial [Rotaria sordida]